MGSSKVESDYDDIVKKNGWTIVYQTIGRKCQIYPYTFAEAKKVQNKPLNRYRDVNPYDHSRIVLKRCETDYINANLVTMARANRKYILTQGPLAYTVAHFWAMVWEQESRAILMLNKIVEKNEIKCHLYWPQGVGEEYAMTLEKVNLIVLLTEEQDCDYYTMRYLTMTDMLTKKTRQVVQFHYSTWPDFGVPSSPVAFLKFLERVRASGALDAEHGPAVVHCSAGIGRSGTFCLVDSCLVIIEKEGAENIEVLDVLLEMRKDRMGLIQTPDQLRFSYQAIIAGTKRLDPNFTSQVKNEPFTQNEEENIYATVAEEEEEAPPLPPPRGESLSMRPLPAIPTSTSLGNLTFSRPSSSMSSTSVDAQLPRPPSLDSYSSSSEEEADTVRARCNLGDPSESVALRRRRNKEIADRVAAMKRKAQDAEQWNAWKRGRNRN